MYKYQGQLEFYFATGEGPFPVIIVSHVHPDIWKKTYAFEKREVPFLTIKHPKTRETVYEGPWHYSRINTTKNQYYPSPEEIDPKVWIQWCQQGYLVDAILPSPIEADLNSVSLSFDCDVWEIKQDQKILKAQACRIYPIIQSKKFDAVKSGFQWWSEEVVKNFYYIEKSKELYIFTENHYYLVVAKSDVINADLGNPLLCHQPTESLGADKK